MQTFTARVRSAAPLTMLVLRGLDRQGLELKIQGAMFNQAQLSSLTLRADNVAVLRIRTFGVTALVLVNFCRVVFGEMLERKLFVWIQQG